MKKTKPDTAAIQKAEPLSRAHPELVDRITACNVCGQPSSSLRLWREHDERDVAIFPAVLVYIGADHPACMKAMEKHPRLYAEVAGLPGSFPRLCGGCTYRRGLECAHPDLKANGGAGLKVSLSNMLGGAILCGPGGCRTPLREAMECVGREETPR